MKTMIFYSLIGATSLFAQSLASSAEPSAPSAEDAPSSNTDVVGLPILETDWGVTLQLKSVEKSGLGLDYSWVPFPNARGGQDFFEKYGVVGMTDWGLKAELKAEGFLGFESAESDNTPRALSITGNIFSHFNVGEIGGQDWWVDVGVSAFELEADQDFDRIHYVAKPFLIIPVPGSHLLSRGVYELFRVPSSTRTESGGVDLRNDLPIYLTAGYALVSELQGEGGRKGEDRGELGVTWQLKVYGAIFDFGYRHYFEDDEDYGFLELALRIPLKKDFAMLIKYVDGELPPSLRASQSVSAGFSISF